MTKIKIVLLLAALSSCGKHYQALEYGHLYHRFGFIKQEKNMVIHQCTRHAEPWGRCPVTDTFTFRH